MRALTSGSLQVAGLAVIAIGVGIALGPGAGVMALGAALFALGLILGSRP